jgi:hypothetical protein
MDADDRVNPVREEPLVRLPEVAGARRRRGRERNVRRGHPPPELVDRQFDPALNVSGPKLTTSGMTVMPAAAATSGGRSAAESVTMATASRRPPPDPHLDDTGAPVRFET